MSDTPNGNGAKLESAMLTLIARWFTVIGFPAIIGLSSYIGLGYLNELKSIRADLGTLASDMRQEFRATDQRVNVLDIRLTGAERDIKYLQGRE